MIEPTRLAYVAGILDTVGRLRVHVTAEGTRLPHVGVSSPNLALLADLAKWTGVKVTNVVRDYDRVGCGDHCTRPHLHVDSVTGRWQLVGHRATLIGQHPTAVDLISIGLAADHKPQTAAAMTRLGWPELAQTRGFRVDTK